MPRQPREKKGSLLPRSKYPNASLPSFRYRYLIKRHRLSEIPTRSPFFVEFRQMLSPSERGTSFDSERSETLGSRNFIIIVVTIIIVIVIIARDRWTARD